MQRFPGLRCVRTRPPSAHGVASSNDRHLRARVPEGFFVQQHDPLTLVDSEPEPDIAVVRGSIKDYRFEHPTTAPLVIEVSIDSIRLDREKASLYATAGVEEYWIVLPETRRVEVYRRPERGAYLDRTVVEGDAELACASLGFVRVKLAELFG